MDFEHVCAEADHSAAKLEHLIRVESDPTTLDDAAALAAMLRALARSVRLALVAGQDDEDIAALGDEIESARQQAEDIIARSELSRASEDPASQRPTTPPPPGYNLARELQKNRTAETKKLTRVTLKSPEETAASEPQKTKELARIAVKKLPKPV
jgi:hypothetical protein